MTGARVWGAALVGLLQAVQASGQAGAYKFARVTSFTDGAVTIDAGSADGVRQWTRLEIVRGGRAVAVLKISSLVDHQSTGTITSRPVPLRVGDYARYMPSGAPTAAVAVAPAPPVPGPPAPTVPDTVASRPRPAAPVAGPVRPTTRIVTPAPGRLADTGRVTAAAPVVRDTARAAAVPKPIVRPSVVTSPAPAPRPGGATATVPPATPPVAPRPAPARSAPTVAAPTPAAPTPAAATTAAPAPNGPGARTARVTFITTSSAYVSAGKLDGLAEGGRVDVVRHGRPVAELKVSFVSTHQAACQIVSMVDSVIVGDTVRYMPVAGAAPAVAQRAPGPTVRPVSQRPARASALGRLRGRVGLYYLTVIQRDTFGGQFSQPSGDIRLNGASLGGTPIGVAMDLRSRRLVQALPGSATSSVDQTRVYQAAVFWQSPGSGFRFTTGRQYAPGISSVGLVDGAAAEITHGSWDYGLFGGMQPELVNLGFSSDISQLGGYVRRHNRVGSLTHWAFTVGGSGSYLNGHTNREFLYLQTNYLTRHLSVYAVQEVDYYRPWRRVSGEKAISPTSVFANIQLQVTPGLSLTTGVDNRRSVRLYRDVVNPATTFDDTFRQGVWAGFAIRTPRHFRASFDVRANHDATTGSANTYTVALGAERLTPLGVSVRTRSTRYTTAARDGWLNSVSLGLEPFGRGSVALTSGWRSERDTTAAPTLNIRWMSADMDVSLARSLFVIVSAYRETGGIEAHDLLYAGLSFRF
jgi:hypothetical protein